jgi:cellulose synthase/poly-beta-1,6-N-acetylglucosamine synthase-like glycosyltransferase
VDDGSTDNTCLRLRQQGWRCVEGGCNRKKPGAIQFLLSCLPPEIETVVVVDPDITIHDDARARLEEVIFDFQQSGMAAVCPRISIRKDGFLARLQALEYSIAFCLGRKSLGDHSVNSGISLYRRSALAAEMQKHSLSVYAEDLENSVLLLAAGERIYYDSRMVVETEGKRTWPSWFSQRVGWSFGLMKVYAEHFSEIRKVGSRGFSAMYQFLIYLGVLTVLLQPLKIISFALLLGALAQGLDSLLGLGWLPYSSLTDPVYFLAAMTKYILFIFIIVVTVIPRGERRYVLPIVPLYLFYALAQVIPTTVGYANWFTLRLCGRRLVRDHFQDEDYFRREYEHKSVLRMLRAKLWPSWGLE